jgi:small neutral amino acid transporter SnatA (MarC family)
MHRYVQGIFTILSLVNPVICGALFSKIVAARSAGQNKPGLMHDVMPRFMGLIVLAMGVQLALTGLKTFFSG